MKLFTRATGSALALVMLAACSGGGGGSGSMPSGGPKLQNTTVHFAILKPPVVKKHALRMHGRLHPNYVSPNTVEIDFTLTEVNGSSAPSGYPTLKLDTTSGSGNCTQDANGYLTCTGSTTAPAADDTWSVSAYGCPSTSGCTSSNWSLLSSSTISQAITVAGPNNISLTLNPVVASLVWAPSSAGIGNGTAGGAGVSLEALDASGNIIIPVANGGTQFQTPIYLKSDGVTVDYIYWSCNDTHLNFFTDSSHGTQANGEGASVLDGTSLSSPSSSANGTEKDPNGDTVTLVGNNGAYAYYDGTAESQGSTPTCTASDSQSDSATFTLTLQDGSVGWTVN